jgi:hypothetical protein
MVPRAILRHAREKAMPTVLVLSVFAEIMTRKGIGMGLRLVAALTALVVLAVVPPARAADLTGTWRGTVDGHAGEFTAAFSEDGYVLFEYTNNKGVVQIVELSAPGQIQFVPPGGGVRTVAVNSVVKRPGGVSYVLDIGFERATVGYLDRRYFTEQREYALMNQGLWVRVLSRTTTYFGDQGGSTGCLPRVEIIEGVLKQWSERRSAR